MDVKKVSDGLYIIGMVSGGLMVLSFILDEVIPLFLMLWIILGAYTIVILRAINENKKDINNLNNGFSYIYDRMSKETHRK